MKACTERAHDSIDNQTEKRSIMETARVLALVKGFIEKCKGAKVNNCPLTIDDIGRQQKFLIRRAQQDARKIQQFEGDAKILNLQENEDGINICKGRIQGEYPIYLPFNHKMTEKIIEHAHKETLHGGVALKMAKVREDFRIPKLRSMLKRIRKNCYGCKRFQVKPAPTPPSGNLPRGRIEGNMPFSVVGVDFARPIKCKSRGKSEIKAYIILQTCALTRGVHMGLLSNSTCELFLSSFKRFIAVRGRPSKVISDNGSAFIAASKWIRNVRKAEKMHDYLAKQRIHW